jgi:hypothetical protein
MSIRAVSTEFAARKRSRAHQAARLLVEAQRDVERGVDEENGSKAPGLV